MSAPELTPDMFPISYRDSMVRAYPVIAGINRDEYYYATPADKDAAFQRVLNNRNLRRTHEMYLEDHR